jgi:hypothetical protein
MGEEKLDKVLFRSLGEILYIDVFPINVLCIPELIGYRIKTNNNTNAIGSKLVYCLRQKFSGHWAWGKERIITDNITVAKEEIMEYVRYLWKKQPDEFGDVTDIEPDDTWIATPESQAIFVAKGLLEDESIKREIEEILSKRKKPISDKAEIERTYNIKYEVVDGQPAISVTISSHIYYKESLKSYAKRNGQDSIIGLLVADKTSSNMKGKIIRVKGIVSKERERLLDIAKRKKTREIISKAPDDELVVTISSLKSGKEYDYVISSLKIILRPKDFKKFGINSSNTSRMLRIRPDERFEISKEIADVLSKRNIIHNAYNSNNIENLFFNGYRDLKFKHRLLLGSNKIIEYGNSENDKSVIILENLHEYGLYKVSDRFKNDKSIKIGVINALQKTSINAFLYMIQQELYRLNFKPLIVSTINTQDITRIKIEEYVRNLLDKNPDVLLLFLPGSPYDEEEEEEWSIYDDFKEITTGKDVASQVVYESTLLKQDIRFAVSDVVLGMLGKTGNIPFILADPLPYADMVVGIDIARKKKERQQGSMNAVAVTRIYMNNGYLLKYTINDYQIEGETIPKHVLIRLFPADEFGGKRVVIHRDGYFRGEEKQVLQNWAKEIGAVFYLVEIIKSDNPRIYRMLQGNVQRPSKGDFFKLNDYEAFLVSSLPPSKEDTPHPLHIRTDGSILIEDAIHSVLALTLLHHGSLRPPRLPVTTHYSDRMSYMLLRGIRPKNLEGSNPFWL